MLALEVGNVEDEDCRLVVILDWLMCLLLFDALYDLMAAATWLLYEVMMAVLLEIHGGGIFGDFTSSFDPLGSNRVVRKETEQKSSFHHYV